MYTDRIDFCGILISHVLHITSQCLLLQEMKEAIIAARIHIHST